MSMLRRMRGIDFQALEHELRLLERTGDQAEDLGQRHPFDFPRAGGALVVGHHRIHQRRGQCWRTTEMLAWM
jgi:hypothetical protein